MLYIPIILGTGREGRQSEKVARFMLQEIEARKEIKTELLDVRDYQFSFTDNSETSEKAKNLGKIIDAADGFIIVAPEYNHGYPGELKMMLDMLYEQYARKPVGICGVSTGGLGGARMVEQLRLVSIEFHMVPIREALYFSSVQNLFNEDGSIKDDSYHKRAKKFLDELIWYADALKIARLKEQKII